MVILSIYGSKNHCKRPMGIAIRNHFSSMGISSSCSCWCRGITILCMFVMLFELIIGQSEICRIVHKVVSSPSIEI